MAESDPLLPEKLAPPPGLQQLFELPRVTYTDYAQATFAFATDKPQCIGHRGYKAAYPENTMAGFRGAVDIGAHALETDVHITKDGVVVLSHVRDSAARCRPLALIYT
jgi:glycerophosphoryl diester phosphodiesterase